MTVCIAIGRILAVGVVVTVGFTAAVGADCADDITDDPSPVATATFLRTVGPLSLSCCWSLAITCCCLFPSLSYLEERASSRNWRSSFSEAFLATSDFVCSSSWDTCSRRWYVPYSAYCISRVFNFPKFCEFGIVCEIYSTENLSHCAVTPMGNTNLRNLFNKLLQSRYLRKFRPAKYKHYTVYYTVEPLIMDTPNKGHNRKKTSL